MTMHKTIRNPFRERESREYHRHAKSIHIDKAKRKMNLLN